MQIESKKAKRELFKWLIRTLEKQDGLTYEFDAWVCFAGKNEGLLL